MTNIYQLNITLHLKLVLSDVAQSLTLNLGLHVTNELMEKLTISQNVIINLSDHNPVYIEKLADTLLLKVVSIFIFPEYKRIL